MPLDRVVVRAVARKKVFRASIPVLDYEQLGNDYLDQRTRFICTCCPSILLST